ncbi:hypothetical protein [Mucilaginibacter sp.]|uniref:hypothetical protein n=1 Tax=Mucilaginibacter sp. TaxID=1882438 RepID=UPI002637C3FD|nr:hypothetical protein [Mucilaginibacter sp.]MDB4923288.1 hypothetical protein [Mucilaginibacter sp.]
MSSFVNNLINRHINTENLIRPRFRSMFEAESLNQGKSAVNEFKANSPVASKTQGFNTEQEPVADITNDQENKNVPATLKPQITLPQQDDDNNLQTEKQVITPKYNVPIQKEEKNNDENVLEVNQFARDVKSATRKLSDINDHNKKVNADSSTIIEASVDKHSTLNSKAHVIKSFLNNDQATVSEQVKNEFQNSKINAYPGTAFFDKYIPLKSKQQPATIQPAIKVTIGQIDVKAISEPQAVLTKNKSAAEPRMSLDDYLKMRNSSKK